MLRARTPEVSMPDLSVPEMRLKDRLPEGLRDMTMDDIQNAMPDVRLPKFDRAAKQAEKAAAQAAKQAEKAARSLEKAAGKQAGKAAKAVENALPRRSGPNPVPIAILAMLGGAVVGWILATNPVTGPRVSAWLDELRLRFQAGRADETDQDDTWDTELPSAFGASATAPIATDAYAGAMSSTEEAGVGVGPGYSEDGGESQPTSVLTDDRA